MHSGEIKVLRVLDMSCTEKELRRWLQTMARLYPLVNEAADYADYTLPSGGAARIAFKPLPMRVIALVRLPRMEVVLGYSDLPLSDGASESGCLANQSSVIESSANHAEGFIKTFMLYTQRGGG